MDKLQWDLRQLCSRNRDGSYGTQAARSRDLDLCARQLKEMGYRDMRSSSLKDKHVSALVTRWQSEGLSPGTVKNRLAHIRWWAEKVGKPSVIPNDNQKLGIPERSYRSEIGKQIALDVEKMEKITDDRVKLSLALQWAFGLRREESIKFQPEYAIRGNALHLKPAWTKGGRARVVPIHNDNQRRVLERVKEVAGKGSLIPSDRTYIQHLKVYERELKNAGISKAHGLRHAYAQERYKELTGWAAPHAGGPKSAELTAEQRKIDQAARMTISEELGHGREEITAVYLGR
jgi:site-specific recombinase XerD